MKGSFSPQRKKLVFKCGLLAFIFLWIFYFPDDLHASNPVQIASSNSPNALAYPGSRKIVRTSEDKLVVVYQDSTQSGPAIKMIYSEDGVDWIGPFFIEYGTEPALAIGADDQIYSCWVSDDGAKVGVCRLYPDTTATQIIGSILWLAWTDIQGMQHPVIEVTKNSVNLLFQVIDEVYPEIFYLRFSLDLQQNYSLLTNFTQGSGYVKYPVIAGDIEFEEDYAYFFWTFLDSANQQYKYPLWFAPGAGLSGQYNRQSIIWQ